MSLGPKLRTLSNSLDAPAHHAASTHSIAQKDGKPIVGFSLYVPTANYVAETHNAINPGSSAQLTFKLREILRLSG
eukprot:5736513-Amphidinium_carterae.1